MSSSPTHGPTLVTPPPDYHPVPTHLSVASTAAIGSGTELVFLGGQVGLDAVGAIDPDDIRSQTRQALANLEAVLHHTGCRFTDVASLTVYLRRAADADAFNDEYRRFAEGWAPPRCAVVCDFPDPRLLVEIQATAVRQTPPPVAEQQHRDNNTSTNKGVRTT